MVRFSRETGPAGGFHPPLAAARSGSENAGIPRWDAVFRRFGREMVRPAYGGRFGPFGEFGMGGFGGGGKKFFALPLGRGIFAAAAG